VCLEISLKRLKNYNDCQINLHHTIHSKSGEEKLQENANRPYLSVFGSRTIKALKAQLHHAFSFYRGEQVHLLACKAKMEC